jgi:NAD-dependent SIR2 family protein deacetylase
MYCKKDGCKGPVKPDITFFGEGLPPSFFEAWDKIKDVPMDEDDEDPNSERKFKDGGCDLMIVVGTALAVGPFN